MSRSVKKNPYSTDNKKFYKKLSNKKVRKYKKYEIKNGKSYKKIYSSYYIKYKHFSTFNNEKEDQIITNIEVLNGYKPDIFYENVNSRYFYMDWYRCYKMK